MVFQYLLLSLVQAATEFLPISSSGHLLFFKGLLGALEIPLIFDIVVHVGSLAAILFFYRKRIGYTCQSAFRELPNDGAKSNVRFLVYVLLSTIVTFLIYLVFKDQIEAKFESPRVLPITYLVTTGILLSTWFKKNTCPTDVTQKKVHVPFIVGLFQGLAILPGISRSGSTISFLLIMGVKKEEAAYYAFFLTIPAIGGALILQLLQFKNIQFLIDNWFVLTLSFLTSAIFSYLFLRVLVWIISRGKMWMFSIYTLVMAVVSWILF